MTDPVATVLRSDLRPDDPEQIRALVEATGYFNAEEVAIAGELAEDGLKRGPDSDYRFLLADSAGTVAGYACFGRIPGSVWSWDLYWIVVHPEAQGRGLGRTLLSASEQVILDAGGSRVYVDTSSRALYEPTRAFYKSCGYRVAAELPDFYAGGDGKVVFMRVLKPAT